MRALGATDGNPSGGYGAMYYGKKSPIWHTRVRCKRDVISGQAEGAAEMALPALLLQIMNTCGAAANECVPIGSK